LLPDVGGTGADVLGTSIAAPESPADIGISSAPSPSGGGGSGQPSGAARTATYGAVVPVHGRNLAMIGALTAASASAIGFVILLLIGVVGSLATGKPLRIPGFG
jgi:hypothetical protein